MISIKLIIGISVGVVVVGCIIGVILAKKKIKKGLDI